MDRGARDFPLGDLRVSDVERDRALSELTDAFQAGRIAHDEFDERSAQILAARTGQELTALLADLPLDRADAKRTLMKPAHRVIAVRTTMGASAVAAVCLAAVSITTALSYAPKTLAEREFEQKVAEKVLARQGISVPVPLPVNPGFDWVGTITPAIFAVLLIGLIIASQEARGSFLGPADPGGVAVLPPPGAFVPTENWMHDPYRSGMSLPSGYNRWCRRYRPAEHAAVRLVCFPHAGGSAPFYLPVAAALSPGVDVVAIQYPGRQERRAEQPIANLMVLADRICDALGGQSEMPMAFFGHSMGALVAFEVARRFEADGHGPSRLFASGCRAPSVCRDEGFHLLDDARLLAQVRRLNGSNSAVLADEELMRATLPALRADVAAAEGYSCAPQIAVSCPISVLVGDNDPKARLADARAWVRHTTGAFDLKVFPGGHFFLADRADEIMKILDRHFRIERDRIVA